MKSLSILFLLSFLSRMSAAQENDIKYFFSQFTNSHYKDLTKEKVYLVDSIISLHKLDFERISKGDTNLNFSDIEFISTQIKKEVIKVWTNQIFENAKIKPNKELLDTIRKSNKYSPIGPITFFTFSLPYFNKEKNVCVIEYNYYCGRLCAENSLRLYKKISGRWTLVKKYWYVVS